MSVDKYDRQTRLWGEGQLLICSSRVLCLNLDGAATEILKNLILAGVGYVSLVDNKKIDKEDLKENFFLNSTDIGKNRAEISLLNLLELNPTDVRGNFHNKSPEDYLNESKLEISTFDIIIVTNQQDKLNRKIISLAESNNQRVIIVRNFGLINYFRLYENFHGSFQLRLPDRPVTDLRIANPFQELKTFCMSIDLDSLDEMKHKHIPYLVILVQALEKYKENYVGKTNPSNSNEKKEFLEILNKMRKFKDEENFNEAAKFYYYVNKDKCNLLTHEIEEIFEILNENSLESLLSRSNVIMSNFFILCKALQVFYSRFNTMPVVGILEDMTSDTENYITLKKIYENKAKQDYDIMTQITHEVIQNLKDNTLGLKLEQIKSTIFSEEINYIEIFCKNWPQISLFHYPTISEEDKGTHYKDNDLDEQHHKINLIWYLLIKSADLFYEKSNRYPGENVSHENFSDDCDLLRKCLNEFLVDNCKREKLPFNIDDEECKKEFDKCLYEFCRMSSSKIVPAVSIISSVASQEVIKFITYQFKSVNNTVIFDGISSTLSTFKF